MLRNGIALALACCVLATPVSAAEPHRLAFSKRLGVDVFALPNEQGEWCRSEMTLSLALSKDSPLMTSGIESFVPKLGPVFAQECPKAEKALVQAYKAENREPTGATYSATKTAGWALEKVSKEQAALPAPPPPMPKQKPKPKPAIPIASLAYSASAWNMILAYSKTKEDLLADENTIRAYAGTHDCGAFSDASRNEFKIKDCLTNIRSQLKAKADALGPYVKIAFRSKLGTYEPNKGAFNFEPLSKTISIPGEKEHCSRDWRQTPIRLFTLSWKPGNGIYGLPLEKAQAEAYVQKIVDDYWTKRAVDLEVIAKPIFLPMDSDGKVHVELELLEARAYESNDARRHLHTFTEAELIEGGRAWASAKAQAEKAQMKAEAERQQAEEQATQMRQARNDYRRLQYASLGTKIAYLVGNEKLDTLTTALGKSLAVGDNYPATFLVQAGKAGKTGVEASWPGRLTLNLMTDVPEFEKGKWYVVAGIMEVQEGNNGTPPTGKMRVVITKQCVQDMCAEAEDPITIIRDRYPDIDWSPEH